MSNNAKLLLGAAFLCAAAWFVWNNNFSLKSYLHQPKQEQQQEYKSPFGPKQPPKEWVSEWEAERAK